MRFSDNDGDRQTVVSRTRSVGWGGGDPFRVQPGGQGGSHLDVASGELTRLSSVGQTAGDPSVALGGRNVVYDAFPGNQRSKRSLWYVPVDGSEAPTLLIESLPGVNLSLSPMVALFLWSMRVCRVTSVRVDVVLADGKPAETRSWPSHGRESSRCWSSSAGRLPPERDQPVLVSVAVAPVAAACATTETSVQVQSPLAISAAPAFILPLTMREAPGRRSRSASSTIAACVRGFVGVADDRAKGGAWRSRSRSSTIWC